MKRIHALLLLLATTFAIYSCTENSSDIVTPAQSDYLKLKTGNYWIYEFYRVDSTGNATKLTATDSAHIIGDTVIDGNTYYMKVQNLLQFTKSGHIGVPSDTLILRDSAGCLVQRAPDGTHTVLFARDNFTDILFSDTTAGVMIRALKMTGKDSLVTVTAGSHLTRSTCLSVYPINSSYPGGTRKYYTVYGAEVGLMISQYGFYSFPDYYEARLVRYHVR